MRVATFIIALGLAHLCAAAAAPAWTVEPPLLRAVAGHAAAMHAGALIVVGGSYWSADEKQIDDTVQRHDQAHGSGWTTLARIPDGFAHGGWAGDANGLWLAGGFERTGPSRAVHHITLGTGQVQTVATLPEPRAYCGAALLDGALWIVGGTADEKDFSRASPTLWRLDLTSRSLRALSDAGPAMINPLVLSLHGELHVLPGGVWSAAQGRLTAPTDVWIFSPRTERWTRRALATPLPRGLAGAALDGERALLAGGFSPNDSNGAIDARAWIYDARNSRLVPAPALPGPRIAAAMIANDRGDTLVLGGEDAPRSRVATVWRRAAETKGGR